MYQPTPGNPYQEPNITLKGQRLQAVENFTYLGSTLPRSANIDAKVTNCIAKASSAFGSLKKSVWEGRGFSHSTKVEVYRAVVLTTLLCGCETWTIHRRHEKQLHQFHLLCLRCILNIPWKDKISNTEVLERAQLPSVITTMRKAQTRWAGHVFRMSDSRIPKWLLYGELSQGARKVGGQHKHFKDSVKAYLKDFNIDITTWENAASDRPAWQSMIQRAPSTPKFNDPTPPKKNEVQERLEPKTPSIRLPLSGARPVAGASMPASVSSAISSHTAECSQMLSDMVIFLIEETNTQWTTKYKMAPRVSLVRFSSKILGI